MTAIVVLDLSCESCGKLSKAHGAEAHSRHDLAMTRRMIDIEMSDRRGRLPHDGEELKQCFQSAGELQRAVVGRIVHDASLLQFAEQATTALPLAKSALCQQEAPPVEFENVRPNQQRIDETGF